MVRKKRPAYKFHSWSTNIVILFCPGNSFVNQLFLFSCLFQALRESEKEKDDCRNNTTLKMHFFGSRGTGHLTFSQFSKYVTNKAWGKPWVYEICQP